MGRQPSFKPIHSDNPELNRIQSLLRETLEPVLQNPLLGSGNFRFEEVAAVSAGGTPTLALQYRTPGTQTWTTVTTFGSSGNVTPASGGGLTSAIQASILTAIGDLIYASAIGVASRLGIGTAGQVLTVVNGVPAWVAASAPNTGQVAYGTTRRWGAASPQPGATTVNAWGMAAPTTTAPGGLVSAPTVNRMLLSCDCGSANAIAGVTGSLVETRPSWNPRVVSVFAIRVAAIGDIGRTWAAITSASLGAFSPALAGGASANHFVGICYDSGISGNWLVVTGDGTNYSTTDTGVSIGSATIFHIRTTLDWTVNGSFVATLETTPEASPDVWVQQFKVTKATNLSNSTTQGIGPYFTVTQLGATDNKQYLGSWLIEQNA